MAFESSANDLVPGDSGLVDIFVFDRLTCAIERVSVNSAGIAANDSSFDPAISDDGRFVAFESGASNLASDANGGTLDVFLRDRQLGTTSLVSVAFDGTQGALQSQDPEISGNGLVVAFISRNPLVPNDTNDEADVFVRDLVAGTTERVSISTAGTEGDSSLSTGVAEPGLSFDGRFVTFASFMHTLVSNDFNNTSDIFVRDRLLGTTVRASVSSGGAEPSTASISPSISADGGLVAFHSGSSSILVPGSGRCDGIFVRDLTMSTTSCLPLRPAGGPPAGNAQVPAISGDGRFVAFFSFAPYTPGDSGVTGDIFVHDRLSIVTRRASVDSIGQPHNGTFTSRPTLSADGLTVAFESTASNLVLDDKNNAADVFVARWAELPDPPFVDVVRNGAFDIPFQDWQAFATPDSSFIIRQFTNGVLEFYRQPPPPGTTNQAVVFQNTTARFLAHAAIEARVDLGNSSSVRKRISILLHDADFSDLSVCTFWLPPGSPLRTYVLRTHTTQFWNNATVAFYAATAGSDGGYYQVDNVTLRSIPEQDDDRTDCVDPLAPTPPGGAAGPELLTNGGFDAGLPPWATFGQIVSQIANGVFEFYRPTGTPAGVVMQQTGAAIPANEILTANFYLGNSSSVRKRVTVLLHDASFSDLSACTFWLPPGLPLAPYRMRTYATDAWTNAMVSIYPATVGDEQWMQLDNVSLQSTPAANVDGTNCLEPGADIQRVLQGRAVFTRAQSRRPASLRLGLPSAASGSGHAETLTIGGVADDVIAIWADVIDLTSATAPRLTFESQLQVERSSATVEFSLDGAAWHPVATLPASVDWLPLDIDLASAAGAIVQIRIVLHAAAAGDVLRVRHVQVIR